MIGPGSRIGVYEVTTRIGMGGMGVVYRGRDTNLGRDVAIKVLPDSFASDPERTARFKREATTLAVLNHPNIASIYGLQESDGVVALVLELVEGTGSGQTSCAIHVCSARGYSVPDSSVAANDEIMAAPVRGTQSVDVGAPVRLLHFCGDDPRAAAPGPDIGRSYDVTPDGARFLMPCARPGANASAISVALDWTAARP